MFEVNRLREWFVLRFKAGFDEPFEQGLSLVALGLVLGGMMLCLTALLIRRRSTRPMTTPNQNRNSNDERTTWHCPRCGALLECSGIVATPDWGECPVFQCDHCVCAWEFGGTVLPAALTFVVGPDGRPFSAETFSETLPPALEPEP